MPDYSHHWIDIVLWIWFALTALSAVYVSWDLITRTPEMKVMKWGWFLVTLYTGPVAFAVYWLSCREPAPGTHERFIVPLWKQAVGSSIHCLAGDATGIIVTATITSLLGLPMGLDAVLEYAAGFSFGLFIFQALFMKDMFGGSYWQAVKGTWLPEWLSMNGVMAGMIPVMVILMTRDMGAMEPSSLRFWGIMSLASLVGAILAYPINYWLVKNKLKHGMGTERALGKGGTSVAGEVAQSSLESAARKGALTGAPMVGMADVEGATGRHRRIEKLSEKSADTLDHRVAMKMSEVPTSKKLLVAAITLLMLVGGSLVAANVGNLSMRPGGATDKSMPVQARAKRTR